jgi:hypothetical protein
MAGMPVCLHLTHIYLFIYFKHSAESQCEQSHE